MGVGRGKSSKDRGRGKCAAVVWVGEEAVVWVGAGARVGVSKAARGLAVGETRAVVCRGMSVAIMGRGLRAVCPRAQASPTTA